MRTTLELPYPSLCEGRFASLSAYTDTALYESHGVRVAFTERTGGCSSDAYESLNVGFHVLDDEESVLRNRKRIKEALAHTDVDVVSPHQVHSDEIRVVSSVEDISTIHEKLQSGVDALVVERDNTAALLSFADCVPVVIVSPSGRFASIHAGWRGVVNGISTKAFRVLQACDRSAGDEIKETSYNVYFGPYIHQECFETGEEVAQIFRTHFGMECVYEEPDEVGGMRLSVDLGAALKKAFVLAGASERRICDMGVCTVCHNDKFFSYRAQEGTCGRHGSFVVRIR